MAKRAGFQSHSPERRREIAAIGGHATQVKGTGHRWTPETAADAGRKGGGRRGKKGFATMDPEAHEDISRAGGSHPKRGAR